MVSKKADQPPRATWKEEKKMKTTEQTPTLTDAKEWMESDEQFLFCVDFLEVSAHHRRIDIMVGDLENMFERMIVRDAV